MTDASRPRAGRAYWSAYQPPEGDTRPTDPLGFDMYAERLGNILLPGITGRTVRTRYLGMVCAGLLTTADEAGRRGAVRAVQSRRESFEPFERGWALSVCENANGSIKEKDERSGRARLADEFRGLRGANHLLSHWRATRRANRWVKPADYYLLSGQSAQGGLGSYLVTLAAAGFVDRKTLGLLEPGRALAAAFLGSQAERGRARKLAADDPVTWGSLRKAGAELDLRVTTAEETAILKRQIFNSETGLLAPAMRGLTLTPSDNPETALGALAKARGEQLSRIGTYALKFDPFRQAALRAFGALGLAMEADGELRLGEIPDTVDDAAAALQRPAEIVANESPPAQLDDVRTLAVRVAEARGTAATLDKLLDWHAERRAPWIVRDGGSFRLGRAGSFDVGGGFHGYTVPSFFSLLRDLDRPPMEAAA